MINTIIIVLNTIALIKLAVMDPPINIQICAKTLFALRSVRLLFSILSPLLRSSRCQPKMPHLPNKGTPSGPLKTGQIGIGPLRQKQIQQKSGTLSTQIGRISRWKSLSDQPSAPISVRFLYSRSSPNDPVRPDSLLVRGLIRPSARSISPRRPIRLNGPSLSRN